MQDRINDNSSWRAFEDSELTHSAAHYLTTIQNHRKQFGYARVTDVADHLKISRGAASRAVSLLKERGWIQEDEHRMLELTEIGQRLARVVERNYLVMEWFLEEVLGLPRETAREDACKMEHLLSPVTSHALFRLTRALKQDAEVMNRLQASLAGLEEEDLSPLYEQIDSFLAGEAAGRDQSREETA